MKKAGHQERAALWDGPYEPRTTIIITGGISWQNY